MTNQKPSSALRQAQRSLKKLLLDFDKLSHHKSFFQKNLKIICASICLHLYLQAYTCIIMEARRDVFQAIADPTRRQIIGMLASKSQNLNSIADEFDMSRQAISLHIKILMECGLISIKQQGRERICEAKLDKLNEVSKWITQYKQHWEQKLDSLELYLDKLKKERKDANK